MYIKLQSIIRIPCQRFVTKGFAVRFILAREGKVKKGQPFTAREGDKYEFKRGLFRGRTGQGLRVSTPIGATYINIYIYIRRDVDI